MFPARKFCHHVGEEPAEDSTMKEVYKAADKYLENYSIERVMRDEIVVKMVTLEDDLTKGLNCDILL